MTRTKVTKTIAILLAMCLAFALMSVTMMNGAMAEAITNKASEEAGVTYTLDGADLTKGEGEDHYYVADASKYEYAPEIKLTVTFDKKDAAYTSPQDSPKLALFARVYTDKEAKKEQPKEETPLNFTTATTDTEGKTIKVDVKLENAKGLKAGETYWLVLGQEYTKTKSTFEGTPIKVEFKVNKVKEEPSSTTTTTTTTTAPTTTTTTTTNKPTTAKPTTRTLKTTARTLTTRTLRTVTTKYNGVKAKAANTGDESNMPLWVALAILAAGASCIAYVWKEN